MKKVRLTESELVGLIRNIISEDEESSNLSMGKKFCKVKTLEVLLQESKKNQELDNFPMRGYRVIQVKDGEASIMNKLITEGMTLKLKDPIKMQEGSEIIFERISRWGQAVIKCKDGNADMSVSWD